MEVRFPTVLLFINGHKNNKRKICPVSLYTMYFIIVYCNNVMPIYSINYMSPNSLAFFLCTFLFYVFSICFIRLVAPFEFGQFLGLNCWNFQKVLVFLQATFHFIWISSILGLSSNFDKIALFSEFPKILCSIGDINTLELKEYFLIMVIFSTNCHIF